MNSIRGRAVALVLSVGMYVACSAGGPGSDNPQQAISVTVAPHIASVRITESVQLRATVHNSTNSAVTWSLSGAGCSGATCGTISSTGLYIAPASVPSPAMVSVTARSLADNSKSDSATITILGAANDAGEWTWVSGSNTGGQAGIYGTKGMSAPSNVPGARSDEVSWMDSTSKLWLFGGGTGFGNNFNDLWKYDPVTNEWTWVSGSDAINQAGIYGTKGMPAPSNVPGARSGAVSWIDSAGNLWLFGGFGYDSVSNQGGLGDLWKYDPATNEWTWVSGADTVNQAGIFGTQGTADPSNVPGARGDAVSWIDSAGNLWLFGGLAVDTNYLNDLWKYDPATNEWTWVSGSNTENQAGVYGTQGTAARSNVPGARHGAVSWIDSAGNLWLFGGTGVDSAGKIGWCFYLNDLWKYDTTTLEWTWVSGADTAIQAGVYGTQGAADRSNIPGARNGAVSWIDSAGNLWLFGGFGMDSAGGFPGVKLNDLWKYDPLTLEWTWVSGSHTRGQAGVYGTKGTANPSNVPGARSGVVSWLDSNGDLWLFGGGGYFSSTDQGLLNDLWKYTR